jgi:Zn-dependent peptidase ImmA (M78 family)/transcriptional regulator with XRE-family HTH domain
MNQLFAERFKSARLMNGYSLQDLSDNLGTEISRQALHKYEKGEVIPDSEMIDYLCDALKVRPDYFTRETLVELGEIKFRKLERFPSKEQNSIIERTREVLTRYLELEEILGIKKTFQHPVPESKINSPDDIETIAEKIREKWNLGVDPIANVSELLEDNNIKLIELEADESFDGLQTWVNGRDVPVIVLNKRNLKANDRKRFTAFHELGHLLLPLEGFDEKTVEKYCHRFAGAMLFPKDAIVNEIGSNRNKISIQELGFLKEQYGISIQAMIYRFFDLGIISDSYKRYFYQYINQMGWKVEEPFEYKGKESSSRFDQLIYRALAEDFISMSKAASFSNMKLAEFRSKSLMVV